MEKKPHRNSVWEDFEMNHDSPGIPGQNESNKNKEKHSQFHILTTKTSRTVQHAGCKYRRQIQAVNPESFKVRDEAI